MGWPGDSHLRPAGAVVPDHRHLGAIQGLGFQLAHEPQFLRNGHRGDPLARIRRVGPGRPVHGAPVRRQDPECGHVHRHIAGARNTPGRGGASRRPAAPPRAACPSPGFTRAALPADVPAARWDPDTPATPAEDSGKHDQAGDHSHERSAAMGVASPATAPRGDDDGTPALAIVKHLLPARTRAIPGPTGTPNAGIPPGLPIYDFRRGGRAGPEPKDRSGIARQARAPPTVVAMIF